MSSYTQLDIKSIIEKVNKARGLINGEYCFDGSDYLGTDIDPDRELKGFYMLELVYKEIEPYLDEIKHDIEIKSPLLLTRNLNALEYVIEIYENEAKYVLEFERNFNI